MPTPGAASAICAPKLEYDHRVPVLSTAATATTPG